MAYARRKPTKKTRSAPKAYTTRRRAAPSRRVASKRTGRKSPVRKSSNQTIRIVIEQPMPSQGARPLYAQQAVAPDRKPRFGG